MSTDAPTLSEALEAVMAAARSAASRWSLIEAALQLSRHAPAIKAMVEELHDWQQAAGVEAGERRRAHAEIKALVEESAHAILRRGGVAGGIKNSPHLSQSLFSPAIETGPERVTDRDHTSPAPLEPEGAAATDHPVTAPDLSVEMAARMFIEGAPTSLSATATCLLLAYEIVRLGDIARTALKDPRHG